MPDQNDDDFSDEVYDDTLDENFEEEFDDDDEYLDLDDDELGAYDDFSEEESDEWDTAEEEDPVEEQLGVGVKKRVFNIDMSFNAMAVTAAIFIGVGVLVFQVITKKPTLSIEAFVSALNMSGASDGHVLGEDNNKNNSVVDIFVEDSEKEETKGFLYDPDILNSMEMELEDTPPMPSPIAPEDKQASAIVDTSLTPLPETQEEKHVPRAPDDVSVAEMAPVDLAGLIDKKEDNVIKAEEKSLSKEKDFLKAAINARDKKEPVVEKIPLEVKDNIKKEVKFIKPVQEVAQVKVENLKTIQPSGDTAKKLQMILDRLDDMDLQITQIREAGNSKIEDISDNLDLLKKEMGSIEGVSIKKAVSSVPKKVTPKKVASVKTKARPKTRAKKKSVAKRVIWELRAAQPGKAWVSKKGQKDMRPIVIGDTLSGIGRITAISYSGNRWVVQGTSGRIRQ